ncbi:MAG: transcription elongation factor GreA [Candidatus Promineifilaceae bacterium]
MSLYEHVVYMTEEGFQNLQNDLQLLKSERRTEINEKLARATALGDLSENASYDAAKQEQDLLEERISNLEDAVRNAEIVAYTGDTDAVCMGCTVTIAEEGWDEAEQYKIVGIHEASPLDGLISNKSPIGTALLGAKVGDTVIALTPSGETRFEVLNIV